MMQKARTKKPAPKRAGKKPVIKAKMPPFMKAGTKDTDKDGK